MSSPTSVSLTLAPHSRLRMDLRLGRVGSISQSLSDDPDLFSRIIKTEAGDRRVGDFLFQEAILSCPSPTNQSLVAYLLSCGASSPETFPGAMSFAMSSSELPLVRLLEKSGWTPEMCEPGGKTSLAWASGFAMTSVIRGWREYLPQPPDENGSNLLHELCLQNMWPSGNEEVLPTAQILIRSGVDWEQHNALGKTPGDLCIYPDIVQDIDNYWNRHRSIQSRKALRQVSAQIRGNREAPLSIAPPKI